MFPVDNIRKICKIRNTTIAEVERDTEISNGTIAKWEDSPRSPQFDYLKKIAERLSCTIEDLYNGEIKEPVTKSDGNQTASNNLEILLLNYFRKLNFEEQFDIVTEVREKSHTQLALDAQKESE